MPPPPSPDPAAAAKTLRRFLAHFPQAGDGALAPVLEGLSEEVGRGALPAHLVEPSVTLGARELRLIVNAGPRGWPAHERERLARSLLRAFGLDLASPWDTALAWLAFPDCELFLGVAYGSGRLRGKVYLAAHHSPSVDWAAFVRPLGGADAVSAERMHMLGIDFFEERAQGFKCYSRLDFDVARRELSSGRLLPLLEAAGIPPRAVTRCHRLDPGGGHIDTSLHVHVSGPATADLALRYAQAAGDPAAVRLLHTLYAGTPVEVRVLSETLGRDDGRHIYLALASG
jgi:hypothetical protein